MSQGSQSAIRVKLGSGKVVLLRELKIRHTELAAQAASGKAGGDQNVLSMLLQKELLKILVISVNDRAVKPIELEDLDGLFTIGEYMQLLSVIGQMTGADSVVSPQIEVVTSGDK